MQGPGGFLGAGNPITPASAAPAEAPLTHHQCQHDHQGDQGQTDCTRRVPFRLPGLQDARGQTGNAQQLHGPQFVDGFHPHQSHAGTDGRCCHGQSNPPEGRPGPNPQTAAGFELPPTAHREAFRAQQEDVGIGRQCHHNDAPPHAVNVPALAAGQIHQRCREQIGGSGQGDQLGDAQPSPAREAAVGQQPAVG